MAKARIAGEVFKNAKGLLSNSSKFLGLDKMQAFGQSNQGAEWNMARMNGGMA